MLMIPLLLDLRGGGYVSSDDKVIDMTSISQSISDALGRLFKKNKSWGEYKK